VRDGLFYLSRNRWQFALTSGGARLLQRKKVKIGARMKKLVILGAGTAGTMMLNKLDPVLDPDEWQITIVDQFQTHYYQPGFLFIPFGIYDPMDVIKPK